MSRIADVPIVLVITLRTHEPSTVAEVLATFEADPSARRMELAALGPAAVAAIVRTVIPAADEELCDAVHEASAGNPLYVRELLRSVSDDGTPPTITAVRQAAAAPVAERVMRRLDALGPRRAATGCRDVGARCDRTFPRRGRSRRAERTRRGRDRAPRCDASRSSAPKIRSSGSTRSSSGRSMTT